MKQESYKDVVNHLWAMATPAQKEAMLSVNNTAATSALSSNATATTETSAPNVSGQNAAAIAVSSKNGQSTANSIAK